jgi:hypothetical protein
LPNQTETALGDCPTHGEVEGTREIPKISFPPIYTSIRRAMAKRKPFLCPTCGAPIDTD